MRKLLLLTIGFLILTLPSIYAEKPSDILSEVVKTKDILPMKIMWSSRRITAYLFVSESEVVLHKVVEDNEHIEFSMPLDNEALITAIKDVPKDFFRGTVFYRSSGVVDGGSVRMITPLGDITEYMVFEAGSKDRSPQAILRLEPLFKLFNQWFEELHNNPNHRVDSDSASS